MSTTRDAGVSKVWFVTGATSGFGRAIAEEAIARGDRVVATARKTASLADLVAKAPDRVLLAELDVTRADQVEAAVAAALARFGAIDVLVNNAGFSIVGAVEETSEEALRETMEPMFFGAVRLTRAVVPHMRERRSGTIVQITSMGGLTTAPGFGAYCAAKHALEGLSECLSLELAPFGVRVLIVEPGAFRTALFGAAFRRMPEIAAYAPTVGPVRAFAADVHGGQAGDPAKAAVAIADAVASEAPPLRLPLGADAVDGIRQKLGRIASDVDRTEAVARATTFSG
ncbi:MAG: SDR family NAD(P)-dependent oxidoreductase [Deltaproteobacteria bacterium]|nr:SDR family NAD(P)-dependent oxidoreductase [Deltaproteobacteria bacterium]